MNTWADSIGQKITYLAVLLDFKPPMGDADRPMWAANAPLAMIDQYVPNLKKLYAVAIAADQRRWSRLLPIIATAARG